MDQLQQRRFFPAALVLYEILIYLSMDAYLPALTKISRDFHASSNVVQVTVMIWMLGAFFAQLIIGPLADRHGRRRVLLTGGVCYVLVTLGCALSPNIFVLIVMRLLQGMTMPTMYISGYAAVNELFDSTTAIKVLARINSIKIIAPAFGPMLGGFLLLYVSWHWIFYLLAILSIFAVTVLYFVMPETLTEEQARHKPDFIKVITHYKNVLKNHKFMLFSCITFLPMVGMIAWIMVAAFVLIDHFHFSPFEFGVIQMVVFGCFVFGTKIIAKFTSPENNRFLVQVGLACILLGALINVGLSLGSVKTAWGVIAGTCTLTFGSGFIMPIMSRRAIETSNQPMGIRVTVFSIVRIGSGVMGSTLMAAFYSGNFTSMAWLMLATAILAIILWRVVAAHSFNGVK